MNAQTVTISNRIPTEPYYRYDLFIKSLAVFAEKPTVLGMNDWWRGLMTKPYRLREWLRAKQNASDRLIVCDAWDIVFASHPHGVGDRCAERWGDAVVFNAERSCWPRTDLAEQFPKVDSPWRFLNSGFMCGPADAILAMLEAMNIDDIGFDRTNPNGGKTEPNDQGVYQELFTKQPVTMIVDSGCFVSQTFSACRLDEFEIGSSGVRNILTGTTPGVLHFNGGSKNDILPAVTMALGL